MSHHRDAQSMADPTHGSRATCAATPHVSVVIVNWNGRRYLRGCLDSLARQTYRDFEVIVVDNASTDGSIELLESVMAAQPGFRITLIRSDRNVGFCAGNNLGFAASRSPLVALLNNDAEADPHWIERLVEQFEERPAIGMAACKILVHEDPRRIDKVGHLIYPDGQNRGRGTGEIDQGQYDRVEEVLWPDGCACMFRRAVLDEVGGFDEDFFVFGDDAELGLRIRIAGWPCIYVPGAIVRHHRGGAVAVASTRRLYLIERNRVLLALKLFPWSLLWLNVPFYLARLLAGAWAALRNKGEIAKYRGLAGKIRAGYALLKGDLVALWMAPRILRKRKEVRRIARLSPREVRQLIMENRLSLKAMMEAGN
jgi:GT2 family glycosyltransferase